MITIRTLEKYIAYILLLFSVWFNFQLYRNEPTALVDPNDNAFQFALVHRTNQIWDFAQQVCPKTITYPVCFFSYASDHWVPNWAEGYNLPFYYSHVPQIFIVATYRLIPTISTSLTLFQYYHWIIYILLCIFPISVFWALKVTSKSYLVAGIGALIASNISTDGLYGLDPSSFLWRGYGLSSQLFAMIFFPQAIAYAYRFLLHPTSSSPNATPLQTIHVSTLFYSNQRIQKIRPYLSHNGRHVKDLLAASFFLWATTLGHLGLGIMAFMSVGALWIGFIIAQVFRGASKSTVITTIKTHSARCVVLVLIPLFFLSYWIIPVLMFDNFHNISYWDPVWKFDSYGAKDVMTRFVNGELFDFGRLPIVTILIVFGLFYVFLEESLTLAPFGVLLIFWILFYFGRTTWGPLIDFIPGMKEFHLSRFIVGMHAAGLFLAPLGLIWLATIVSSFVTKIQRSNATPLRTSLVRGCAVILLGCMLMPQVFRQTISYSKWNDELINKANTSARASLKDTETLFQALRSLPPGRVFAGRGGWWGKDLKIAETPFYMHLSTYGIPTVLWLPETWSPNSDTEQFISESRVSDYDLYNLRYVVAPLSQKPEPFWKRIEKTPSWNLYEVQTSGYFTYGTRAAIVSATKRTYINVIHQWIQSDFPAKKLFPQLTFSSRYPLQTGLPNFRMIDEITYKVPDGSTHNLNAEPPTYMGDEPHTEIQHESNQQDMIFSTDVTVGSTCRECMVILKQTFHPNWIAVVDGKQVATTLVFPFFIGVPVSAPGTHHVVLSYTPLPLKVMLIYLELFVCFTIICIYCILKFARSTVPQTHKK